MDEILFRTVIEVAGKPQEYVEKSLKEYVEKIKKDKRYKIVNEDLAEIKKHEKDEIWATFAELEVKTEKLENITEFCFQYMPSLIEILEPEEFKLTGIQFSQFLNDLQAQLHEVDMIAKKAKIESDFIKNNMRALLKNYVTVLLTNRKLTSQELSKLTGIDQDRLEDYLDILIDEGKIDLKDDQYFLKDNE